jgi:hypothetical protein
MTISWLALKNATRTAATNDILAGAEKCHQNGGYNHQDHMLYRIGISQRHYSKNQRQLRDY